MFPRWLGRLLETPWWRHLIGVPLAVALIAVWLSARPKNPWPAVVILALFVVAYVALAVAGYRHGRAQRHRRPD